MWRAISHAVVFAIATPTLLCAQEEVTALTLAGKLFDNFTDFGVFVTANQLLPKSNALSLGRWTKPSEYPLSFGAELSWKIGSVTKPVCAPNPPLANTQEGCVAPVDDQGRARMIAARTCGPDKSSLSEIRVDSVSRVTAATYVYKALKCDPPEETEIWLIEMGVAYIQSTLIRGVDPSLGLQGVMKEAPRIALYGSYQPWSLAPYFGAFFGLSELDLRTSGIDSVMSGSASSVTAGVAIGAVRETFGPFNLFVELDYVFAPFSNIQWSNEANLRPGAPNRVNVSNINLSFGFQVAVREKEK